MQDTRSAGNAILDKTVGVGRMMSGDTKGMVQVARIDFLLFDLSQTRNKVGGFLCVVRNFGVMYI